MIKEALKTHRVILLDQRGTGRSHRIDCDTLGTDADKLHLLRQEFIVHDAEALRKALGISAWTLYGQSFGGFCITSYLSLYPESVDKSYITGVLPALEAHVDDVYRATYAAIARRSEEFYSQFPWVEARIREICHHLDNSDEKLPTGERLSSRRFRTIGITLGRSAGFYSLGISLRVRFRKTERRNSELMSWQKLVHRSVLRVPRSTPRSTSQFMAGLAGRRRRGPPTASVGK